MRKSTFDMIFAILIIITFGFTVVDSGFFIIALLLMSVLFRVDGDMNAGHLR